MTATKEGSYGTGGHPIDPRRFRHALSHFASGITIVTATTTEGPVGFTCQAFTALSLDPLLVALAPGKNSASWPKIAAAQSFCVNILTADQQGICRSFAVSSTERSDKFTGVGWQPAPSGAPILDGVLVWIDCSVLVVHDAGDHELVIGQVSDLGIRSGEPLVFYQGAYRSLEPA